MTVDRRANDTPIQISEAELSAMTADMDEMHHGSLPALRDAVDEFKQLADDLRSHAGSGSKTAASRRQFLFGSGVVLGGLALAACSSSSKSSSTTTATNTPTTAVSSAAGKLTGDLAIVALAAGLENLAVGTYQAGITAAKAGKLGTVPPAVVTFATTAQSHHTAHAAAWNAVLAQAGKPAVTGVDKTVKTSVVDPAFAKVTDVAGLAKLALALENVAAATYLNGIGLIQGAAGIQTAASIQPVELQHAAILNFVLGQYPVPNAFALTTGARVPSDVIG
ncbi:MAG: ferritin-like domain-containing protein [Acidimicrobiia bacterium]